MFACAPGDDRVLLLGIELWGLMAWSRARVKAGHTMLEEDRALRNYLKT